MKLEVLSAANFLTHILRLSNNYVKCTTERRLKKFRNKLVKVLQKRYEHYWFPETPIRGSGFRVLRITDARMDPIVERAGALAGLNKKFLEKFLIPVDIYVDPLNVSYRLSDSLYWVDLFKYGPGVNSPWVPPFKRKKHTRYIPEETTSEKVESIVKQTKKKFSLSEIASLISG